jgi:hypothetical protein
MARYLIVRVAPGGIGSPDYAITAPNAGAALESWLEAEYPGEIEEIIVAAAVDQLNRRRRYLSDAFGGYDGGALMASDGEHREVVTLGDLVALYGLQEVVEQTLRQHRIRALDAAMESFFPAFGADEDPYWEDLVVDRLPVTEAAYEQLTKVVNGQAPAAALPADWWRLWRSWKALDNEHMGRVPVAA